MSKNKKKVNLSPEKRFNRIMTIISIIFLLVLFFKFGYTPAKDMIIGNSSVQFNLSELQNTVTEPEEEKPKDITISLAVVGDIMCHDTNYKDAYNSETKTYDFSHVFTNVADKLRNADLTIGNLETTFAGSDRGYSGYPTFNTPDELATNLKDLGFDVLSTSNNHSLDKGYSGLTRTLEVLDENGISHMGTYSSEESSEEILVKDVNGVKIAFLAYTYGTNGIPIPSGKEYCVNLIDKDKIKADLEKAKALDVDLISVSMHWGNEYRLKSTTEQENLADFLFENGADIILGSHPHVLEPMERSTITLDDGTTKDGFLIYSLGNFISGQTKQYTNHSIILNITLTKHAEGNITIDDVSYTPTYVDNRGSSADERFKILDINQSISAYEAGDTSISKSLYNKLTAALDATNKILARRYINKKIISQMLNLHITFEGLFFIIAFPSFLIILQLI